MARQWGPWRSGFRALKLHMLHRPHPRSNNLIATHAVARGVHGDTSKQTEPTPLVINRVYKQELPPEEAQEAFLTLRPIFHGSIAAPPVKETLRILMRHSSVLKSLTEEKQWDMLFLTEVANRLISHGVYHPRNSPKSIRKYFPGLEHSLPALTPLPDSTDSNDALPGVADQSAGAFKSKSTNQSVEDEEAYRVS